MSRRSSERWDGNENPFCTSRIRPGAVDFIFGKDESLSSLVARLDAVGWRGQIVGPHGSGKSTLLASLLPEARVRFEAVEWWNVRSRGSHWLPAKWLLENDQGQSPEVARLRKRGAGAGIVFFVEGWELMPFWQRWASRLFGTLSCPRVVATGHKHSPWFGPVVYETWPDEARFLAVCHHLQRGMEDPLAESELIESWRQHHGNAREALLALYDVIQSRD